MKRSSGGAATREPWTSSCAPGSAEAEELFREDPTLIRKDLLLVFQHRLEVAQYPGLIAEDLLFVRDDLVLVLACRGCHGLHDRDAPAPPQSCVALAETADGRQNRMAVSTRQPRAGEETVQAQSYDAIVVGSGIAGGWAAKELTEKGLRVLLLERGKNVEHIKDYFNATKAPWQYPHRGGRPPDPESTPP